MKTKIIAILSILLIALLSTSAIAANYTVDISSEYYERSNPYEDGDDDEIDGFSDLRYGTVTVSPVNGSDISDVSITLPYYTENRIKFGFISGTTTFDEDNVEYEKTTKTKVGDSFKFTFMIPPYLDSVSNNGEEVSHSVILSINSSGDGSNYSVESYTQTFKVINKLSIGDVTFDSDSNNAKCDIDYDKDKGTITEDCDDDDLDKFRPGQRLYVEFEIENEFDDADIEDVDVSMKVTGDEDDYDDGSSSKDIDAGDEESYSLFIDPEDDAEDIDVEIEVTGEDEFGARHGFKLNIDNEVKFEIPDYEVEYDIITARGELCPGDFTTISVDVTNRGSEDQDQLILELEENNLDWSELSNRFALDGEDNGDYESRTIDFNVQIPEDAVDRTYSPRISLFYESDDRDDEELFETFSLTIADCSGSSDTDSSGSNSGSNTDNDTDSGNGFVVDSGSSTTTNPQPDQPTTSTGTTNTGSAVVTAQPKENNALQTVGIIVLVIILLAVIVSLVGMLLKK